MWMRTRKLLTLSLIAMAGVAAPALVSAQSAGTQRTNLIILSHNDFRPTVDAPVLQLIRQRLPLGVHQGRFLAQEGESTFCIFSRRRAPLMSLAPSGEKLPTCPMISVYLDGKAVKNPGALLTTARAMDLQSVELVNDSAALRRYGVFDDVLSLWSKGNGPYAQPRPARMNDDAARD